MGGAGRRVSTDSSRVSLALLGAPLLGASAH
jgi:hypothetical protein